MKFRATGILTAAAMTASLLPASAIVAYAEDGAFYVTKDYYDFWYDNIENEGEAKMQPLNNGRCECTWNSVEECQFNDGVILSGENDISAYGYLTADYDVDVSSNGNAYFGYTGKMKNPDPEKPDIEFWIVDGWMDWRPPGMPESKGTVYSDGKSYDIYEKISYEPDENGEMSEKIQYYSVVKTNLVSSVGKSNAKGTVSIYKHFEAWEQAGLDVSGNILSVSLSLNAFRSSGSFTVNRNGNGLNFNLFGDRKKKGDNTFSEQKDGYDFCCDVKGTMGRVDFKSGIDGKYNGSWNGVEKCQFTAGLTETPEILWERSGGIQLDYTLDIISDYEADAGYSGVLSDSSGVYKNAEYRIIEAWDGEIPLEDTEKKCSYTVNGNEYDLYVFLNETGAENYWGIRNEAECKFDTLAELSGTVNLTEHLTEWKKAVPDLNDTVSEIKLSVNATGGNGSVDVKKNEIIFNEPLTIKEKDSEDKDAYRKLVGSEISVGHTVSPDEMGKYADYYGERFDYFTLKDVLNVSNLFDAAATAKSGSEVNPQVSLEKAAPVLKYCEENNIPIFGGAFIFEGRATREFFRENYSTYGYTVSREVLQQRLENLIKNTFEALRTEYPNLKICGYEVCRNLFDADFPYLRGRDWSGEYDDWYEIYENDDYIYDAYTFARKYAPEGTKLYYSECNEYFPLKTMAVYKFVSDLQARGLIDGIGLEASLNTAYPYIDEYRTAVEIFSYTGLDIKLTRFQATVGENQQLYADIIRICRDLSKYISGINFNYTGTDLKDDGSGKPDIAAINEYLNKMPETEKSEVDGDANSDGSFNIADVVTVQLFLQNSEKCRIDDWENADLDNDGELTVFDLCIMKNELLDVVDEYF